MMGGKWFITPHAVRRYQERIDPTLTYNEALTALIRHSEKARRVKHWRDNLTLYRSGKPQRLRFLVAEDGSTLVTVYGGRGK